MPILDSLLLAAYFGILLVLSLYGTHRYQMAWLYRRNRDKAPVEPAMAQRDLPAVTIQLPVFNERYVVERLIDHVCRIRYPAGRLEIQVLDDSTDDTVDIARAVVRRWAERGVDIVHIHRTDRTGFKAGALDAGMRAAKGEFVAVFDADFLPEPDFLERTMPHFIDPGVGMVQARWEHVNRGFSVLTQAQSIFLDGHFVIEHTARNRSGRFFNFNGTAGVWRRTCIDDGGGWQHDTLTEDLDLSYRAQLRGWRFVFLKDVVAPAEVPVDMNAFKSQQHRWAKGSIQVALKLLPRILRSDLPRRVKMEAFVHLTNNLAYPLMVALSILMPFTLEARVDHGWRETLLIDLPFFFGATVSICAFYLLSQREGDGEWRSRILYIPVAMSLGIGLAVNNAKATFEALFGHESPFVRTPKHGVLGSGGGWLRKRYRGRRSLMGIVELALAAHYTWALAFCVREGIYLSIPFLMLFQAGFLYVGIFSLFPGGFRTRRPTVEATTA